MRGDVDEEPETRRDEHTCESVSVSSACPRARKLRSARGGCFG